MVSTTARIPQSAWVTALAALGYRPAADGSIDFETPDGSMVVEVVERRRASVRDLRAALSALAIHVAARRHVRLACLLLTVERMTLNRLRSEWNAVMATLRPEVGDHLALVALGEDFCACLPAESAPLVALAEAGRGLLGATTAQPKFPRMPKSVAVFKVLLARWLLDQAPISRRELGEQAGCSYPTIAKAVDALGHPVRHHRNRRIGLAEFPHAAWSELLARAPSERARVRYADRSGRPPDTEGLLRRLRRLNPSHAALGGVVAAHHWDAHFDLRGLPRLDVCLEAAGGVDLTFVRRLDPALEEMTANDGAPVLVVHPLQRPAPLFVAGAEAGLAIADPVETLLDLSEMRLVEQATALIERMERRRAGNTA